MSITTRAYPDSPVFDYTFNSPEGLLELCNHYVLVTESHTDRDYLSALALMLGLNREVLSQDEWDDLSWEHQPVFKWFVDLGEFAQ